VKEGVSPLPIDPIVLQRRHTELGRIRLGDKGDRGQPQKRTEFRFTSPSERHIRDLAQLYGGDPVPWDNKGKAEWEVKSTAKSIPVIVVKGGLSQWMESWGAGGCIHRCDGVINQATGQPCDADEYVEVTRKGQVERFYVHRDAKPTTRFSVMLPELEAIGVFRLETHGWNAGSELPPMVELAMHLGDLVPARLMLAERIKVKDGKTNRFVVPTLDLGISAARLTAIANGTHAPAAVGGVVPQAIAAAQITDELTDALADCHTADDVRALWRKLGDAGQLTPEVQAALTARGKELADAEPVEGVADPDMSVDDAWSAMVAEAGKHGFTASTVDAALVERFEVSPDQLSAAQLVEFTADLKAGNVAA
jgi:hypothetical protein